MFFRNPMIIEVLSELSKNDEVRDFVKRTVSTGPHSLAETRAKLDRKFNELIGEVDLTDLMTSVKQSHTFEEKDDSYKWTFVLPGLTSEDVSVSVEKGRLKIQKTSEDKEDETGISDITKKVNIDLEIPEEALDQEPKALMRGGVLQVTILKKVATTKTFSVSVKGE